MNFDVVSTMQKPSVLIFRWIHHFYVQYHPEVPVIFGNWTILTSENRNLSKEKDQFPKFKSLTLTRNYRVSHSSFIAKFKVDGPSGINWTVQRDFNRLLMDGPSTFDLPWIRIRSMSHRFNLGFLGPEAYQCAFTSDLKRLLIISLDGTYHRYRLRISKQQDPLHEHTVNFLNTTWPIRWCHIRFCDQSDHRNSDLFYFSSLDFFNSWQQSLPNSGLFMIHIYDSSW